MKIILNRIYPIFIALSLCLLCCSCSNKGTDYTISVDSFDISNNIAVSAVGGAPEFAYSYDNAEDLSEVSQIVVIGEVIDIYYDDTNARPSTLYDFQISQVLRGNFETNDTITVEEYGGFIRGSVYKSVYGELKFDQPLEDDELVHISHLGNAPPPEIGDNYILFLTESDIIPGAYCTFGTYMGKYIIESGAFVSRYDPDAPPLESGPLNTTELEPPLTVNDIIVAVEETPFDIQVYTENLKN